MCSFAQTVRQNTQLLFLILSRSSPLSKTAPACRQTGLREEGAEKSRSAAVRDRASPRPRSGGQKPRRRLSLRASWHNTTKPSNNGTSGIDGITIEKFPAYAHDNWIGIKASLLDGSYRPSPVKRVKIPKDSGGTRTLDSPTVIDRVIQQAIFYVLTRVFAPHQLLYDMSYFLTSLP